ncbi:MAG: dienelactone hydrolase family protein [Candidatus Omnitrophica bacterium]|nr:dienelactone hydrolase family protein [Candidatus Omnitrophota bacterium]
MAKKLLIILTLAAFLNSFPATDSSAGLFCKASGIASRSGFQKKYIKAGQFNLLTYQRFKATSDNIRIYIEGDGMAWKTRTRLSDDPTPSEPVALELASVDPSDAVFYIARPGQFPETGSPDCEAVYWSEKRFAPEVVEAFDKAIDALKARSGAKRVELIGYSGGGAIAVLVAARRSDVVSIRTVAGNLDPGAACDFHKVSYLEGSMDPLSVADKLSGIPQRHFSGEKDKIIPSFIAISFAERTGDKDHKRVTKVPAVSHNKGWREKWPELLSIQPQ